MSSPIARFNELVSIPPSYNRSSIRQELSKMRLSQFPEAKLA